MDYYYALLNSYDLLKKRKFKLSLREAEGEGDEKAREQAKAEAEQAFAAAREITPEERKTLAQSDELTFVKSPKDSPNSGKTTGIGGPFKSSNMKAVTSLDKLDDRSYNLVIGYYMEDQPAGDQEGAEDTSGKEIKDQGEKAATTLQNLIDSGTAFPGLRTDIKHTRRPQTLISVVTGGAQGYSGEIEELGVRVLNSETLPEEERVKALKSLNNSLDFLAKAQEKGWSDPDMVLSDPPEGMTEQEAKQLGELLGKMRTTQHGVTIDGISFFYRDNSTSETDVVRNMADQLDAIAEAYNSDWEGVEPTTGEDPKITRLKHRGPSTSGGANESYRGPVAEKFMRVSLILLRGRRDFKKATTPAKEKAAVDKMRNDVADVYEEAKADGSMDKMVEVFGVGASVLLGEIVANEKDMSNAEFSKACVNILIERGMDKKRAEEFVTQAGGQPPERGVAMALIVTTMVNQEFDVKLFGDDLKLIPDNIIHEGDKDATSSGRKADLVFEWDDEEKCEQIAAHYKKKLGDTASDSGCEGEGSGIDGLVTPKKGGGCKMSVELKTLSSAQRKGGGGEMSASRLTAICNDSPVGPVRTGQAKNLPKGVTQSTRDFADKNKSRLDKCLGEGTFAKGCAMHKKIQEKAGRFIRLLTPGSPGVTTERSMAALKSWKKNKRDDDKTQERYDAAERAINNHPNVSSEDQAQLDKIHRDMEQMVFMREVHRTSEGAGKGKGKITDPDMQAYMALNLTTACGSDEEVLRVTRGVEDGYQSVYLNNATQSNWLQMISAGEATWDYGGGGTFNLKDKDGKTLASDDTARGNNKWEIKKQAKNIIESVVTKTPELLVQFLQGQQALLEKLMNQTT